MAFVPLEDLLHFGAEDASICDNRHRSLQVMVTDNSCGLRAYLKYKYPQQRQEKFLTCFCHPIDHRQFMELCYCPEWNMGQAYSSIWPPAEWSMTDSRYCPDEFH